VCREQYAVCRAVPDVQIAVAYLYFAARSRWRRWRHLVRNRWHNPKSTRLIRTRRERQPSAEKGRYTETPHKSPHVLDAINPPAPSNLTYFWFPSITRHTHCPAALK
jgi:hypothetical protein